MTRSDIGVLPRPARLADDSYLEFAESARITFRHGVFPVVSGLIDDTVKEKFPDCEPSLDELRAVCDSLPITRSWRRLMRSHHEMIMRGSRDAFEREREDILAAMEAATNKGPGTLTLNPELELPGYMRHQIHLQPGSYAGDEMAGIRYLYSTKAFYLGLNDQDELHREVAYTSKAPEDGKVANILQVGCGLGQAAQLLKARFPNARVTGIDAAAPMLKYAHWRATLHNVDVDFTQCLAEDTGFADARFDMVLVYILFHEMPVDVTQRVVHEIYRMLRPGGEFLIFDFPTARKDFKPSERFLIDYDNRFNCEPYSPGFVSSDFDAILKHAGFDVTTGPANMNGFLQTLSARKPD